MRSETSSRPPFQGAPNCGYRGLRDAAPWPPDAGAQIGIARADLQKQGMQLAVGLDINAAPAVFIKMERHAVLGGMAHADIDVEAELMIGKRAAQDRVFSILRVGHYSRSGQTFASVNPGASCSLTELESGRS